VDARSALSILVGAFVIATGCTSRTQGVVPSASAAKAPSSVVVTRDDPSLPTDCRPRAVATLLTDFFDALNRSSPVVIGEFFAPAPKFKWYSVTEAGPVDDRWRQVATFDRSRLLRGPNGQGRHFVTYDPAGLRRYLAHRQAQHERMFLLAVDVGEQSGPPHPEAGIAYVVRRAADDLHKVGVADGLALGKGEVDCVSGRISVWSMAMEAPPAPAAHDELKTLCPAPSAGVAADAVVACARR
jgi:hypothetical protein